jgi:hypothetical protein
MDVGEARSNGHAQLARRMAHLVPGFAAYEDASTTWNDDTRLRVEICERLDRAVARLEDQLLDASEPQWSAAVEAIDQAIRHVELIRESVSRMTTERGPKTPPHGRRADSVASLLETDLGVLSELDALERYLDPLPASSFQNNRLRTTLDALEGRFLAIEVLLERRADLLQIVRRHPA